MSDAPADHLDQLLAHRAWVRAVARALVSDPNDADDVEQQTWLLAAERPPRHGASLRGWLGTTARNVARKLGRGRTRRTRHEALVPPGGDAVPAADLVAEAEVQQRIGQAVLALEEPFRSTVLLRYFEGLAPADVAARLGVPVETVRSRLRRAHERLRAQLDRDAGGKRAAWAMAVLSWDAAGPSRPPAPAPVPVPASLVATGGLAMSIAKKVLVAAALLLAAGGTTWVVVEGASGAPQSPPEIDADAAAAATDASPRNARAKRAASGVSEDAAVAAPADALPPPVDLDAADRNLDLHGTVVDAAGAGVPGAQISTVTYPWRVAGVLNHRDHDVEVAGPVTRSARDGTFALRLARGDTVHLRVAAAGFASVEVPSVLAGERVRVTMTPGVRLVVAFADAAGAPLAGAAVRVFAAAETTPQIAVRAKGTTGADGVCALDGLPPSLDVFVDPSHPAGNGSWTRVTLPAEGEMRREIRIGPARTVRGTVIDADSRQPVVGARVGMNWTLDSPVKTGADGTYALTGWTGEGVSDVHVRAEEYAGEERVVGDATTLDFELHRGYAAAGRVVGADGAAVAGALVSLIASDFANGAQRTSDGYTTSGPDGRFRVTGLRFGMRHVIVVVAPGHARIRRETPPVAAVTADDQDLGDVALPRPQRVEGVLLEGDGSPSRRVPVTMHCGKGEEEVASFYGRYVSAVTDDLGRFRFGGVAPDWYLIKVRPAGAQEIRADVKVPPGRDVLDVRIARASTRKVRFTVTDADGAPHAGTWVNLTGQANQQIQARTGDDGSAVVDVPTAVRLQFSAWAGEEGTRTFLQPPWRELPDDAKDVSIVLEEAAKFSGRVVGPDDAPVAGAWMKLVGAAGQESWAQAGADGRFEALIPRAGRATLVFDGTAYRDGRGVDSGLTARVEGIDVGADVVVRCARVPSDRKLAVVVVSPSGEPVAEAWVNVTWGGGSRIPPVKTGADGRAAFESLPAREIDVVAGFQRTDFLAPERAAVVPDGQEVRLVGRVASRITGTVADEKGRGFPGVGVQALRDGKQVGHAFTDAEGRFALLLPATDTAAVRLYVDRNHDDTPDVVLDGVAPGTPDVRLVIVAPAPTTR